MSIIDILTKWALDKLDERVFAKEDVSTEVRLKQLYVFIEKMPNTCEDIANEIYRMTDDEFADSEAPIVVQMKELNADKDVKTERTKISKFRKKTFPKLAKPIVQDVNTLKFDFDKRRNFRGMSEKILKQVWGFDRYLHLMERRLADYQVAIEGEDEGAYLDSKRSLHTIADMFKQYAESFQATVDRILEFSKEV